MGLTKWTVDGWTAYQGYPWVDDAYGCAWLVETEQGWRGRPAPRRERVTRPRRRGEYASTGWGSARLVELGGRVLAPDHATLVAAAERFAAILADEAATYPLVVDEDGLIRLANVQIADQFQVDLVNPTLGTWSLPLIAPDPVKYSATADGGGAQSTATALPAATVGLVVPVVMPAVVSVGGTDGTVHLTNDGTTYTWPVLEIAGQVDNPRVEHPTTGRVLEFATSVGAGETLTVDPAAGTVLLGTANRYGTLTAASSPLATFVLPPGPNDLAYRAQASAGGTTLTVRWRHAYL